MNMAAGIETARVSRTTLNALTDTVTSEAGIPRSPNDMGADRVGSYFATI
jgi:hypothetical protein